jgi:hypothetical protein
MPTPSAITGSVGTFTPMPSETISSICTQASRTTMLVAASMPALLAANVGCSFLTLRGIPHARITAALLSVW